MENETILETLPAELETLPNELIEESSPESVLESESSQLIELNEQLNELISFYQESLAADRAEDPLEIVPFAASDPGYVHFNESDNIYSLRISGTTYTVLFPEGAALAVKDDTLINIGSSNITGVILTANNGVKLTDYNARFYTLYPVTQTSGQANMHRYGAAGYITTYSPGTGQTLTNSVSYAGNEVLKAPGAFSSFPTWSIILIGLVVFLVMLNLAKSLFGGKL